MSLRLAGTEKKYRQAKADGKLVDLRSEVPLKRWRHFIIIKNRYPHDMITTTHHLLIPLRQLTDWKSLNWRERKELRKIDDYCARTYDSIKMNYSRHTSRPDLLHWHLVIYKEFNT